MAGTLIINMIEVISPTAKPAKPKVHAVNKLSSVLLSEYPFIIPGINIPKIKTAREIVITIKNFLMFNKRLIKYFILNYTLTILFKTLCATATTFSDVNPYSLKIIS